MEYKKINRPIPIINPIMSLTVDNDLIIFFSSDGLQD